MIKKIVTGLFIVSVVLGQAMAAKPKLPNILNLYLGEVRVLKIGDIERVAIGRGEMLSTSMTKDGQLIILPEKKGRTLMHIWGKSGWEKKIRVHITESDSSTETRELRELLESMKGVKVRAIGGRPIIEGTVNDDEMQRLQVIKKIYPGVVILAKKSKVFHDKMINMRIQITEFNTSALEKLGVDWDTNIAGPRGAYVGAAVENPYFGTNTDGISDVATLSSILPLPPLLNGQTFGYFGIATQITSRLNFLVQNGDALVLASPHLSARSGGEAEFLVGGEIPLPVVNRDGQTSVTFKEYGIKLKISPAADDAGNITARVLTEISQVDESNKVEEIPGFLTRKTQADLSMKNGETIVISGLTNLQMAKDISKVKWLGSIPILGALFRSESFRDKKTELVIFVTPTIFDADSEINKKGVARSKQLIQDFKSSALGWFSSSFNNNPSGDILD